MRLYENFTGLPKRFLSMNGDEPGRLIFPQKVRGSAQSISFSPFDIHFDEIWSRVILQKLVECKRFYKRSCGDPLKAPIELCGATRKCPAPSRALTAAGTIVTFERWLVVTCL